MFGVHDVNGRDFSNRKVLSRQNLNPSHATLQYARAWTSLRMEIKADITIGWLMLNYKNISAKEVSFCL